MDNGEKEGSAPSDALLVLVQAARASLAAREDHLASLVAQWEHWQAMAAALQVR